MRHLSTILATSLLFSACAAQEDDGLLPPSCEGKCDDSNAASGFEVWKSPDDGKYYFHLVGKNGHVVLRSQGYTSKAKAKQGIASVQENGLEVGSYEIRPAAGGEYYYVLEAANHQVIAVSSETFPRKYSAARSVETAIRLVGEAGDPREAHTGEVRFLTFRGTDNQYYFHVRDTNGEIVLQSEGYAQGGGMANGIESVKENAARSERFEVLETADGKWFFHLLAGNGQIIGRGRTYPTKSGARKAVAKLVAHFAAGEVLEPEELPTRPLRPLSDYPYLVTGMGVLAKVHPVYFGAAEAVRTPDGATCTFTDAATVEQDLVRQAKDIFAAADLATLAPGFDDGARQAMFDDLHAFLGADSFNVCQVQLTATQGFSGTQTYVISSRGAGPSFVYELGASE